jgi:hypothetical protein
MQTVAAPWSWVIEVTNDQSNPSSRTEIDRRDNCHDLNGRGISRTFEITRRPSAEFRCIRIRQTGPHNGNFQNLVMDAFEVFGELRIRTIPAMSAIG